MIDAPTPFAAGTSTPAPPPDVSGLGGQNAASVRAPEPPPAPKSPHAPAAPRGGVSTTRLSVVLPVYNEELCLVSTLDELFGVLHELGGPAEVLAIDDGSTDATPRILREYRQRQPLLRVLTLAANSGQSAAFGVGFRAARGSVTVLMDADGQNDPRDIPALLKALEAADVCCGIRLRRKDSLAKRLGSRLANRVRNWVLQDGIIDTGCSLKAVRTELLRDLPMNLSGMHRFIPALLLMKQARIVQIPVRHRPRTAGRSKYTNFGRLAVTVHDLRAVAWMRSRHRSLEFTES